MDNILIDFGTIKITYYAIFIVVGMLLAYFFIIKEADKYGYNKEFIGNLFFWTIIFGIIGARLYYVLFNWGYYKENINEIYQIWNGGLAIHGGIIFGILFIMIYCFKYKISITKTFDIFVVGLILGQAIGRWGNFFNQEAHGMETTKEALQSLFIIPQFVINGMKIDGIYYHPTFYYESLWCLLGFILLLIIRQFYKKLKVGQLTSLYLIWYGVGRFFIEVMRTDSLMFKSLKVARVMSVFMILIGLFFFIKKALASRFNNLYVEEYVDEIKF